MTQPAEPTPGASAIEPTAPPSPTVPTEPTGQAPAAPAEDISALPDWAQKQIRDARSEAGKARTNAKQAAAEEARAAVLAEFAQKLGLAGGEDEAPVSPDVLTQHLEQAQSTAFRASIEGQLFRAASRAGVDGDALLDSKRFEDDFVDAIDEVESITEMDPRSREFAAAVEAAMQQALEKNPHLRPAAGPTGPRPDPSQGARGNGPDVDSRIAEAQRKGDWRTVISLQNQKLTQTT